MTSVSRQTRPQSMQFPCLRHVPFNHRSVLASMSKSTLFPIKTISSSIGKGDLKISSLENSIHLKKTTLCPTSTHPDSFPNSSTSQPKMYLTLNMNTINIYEIVQV